MRRIFQRPGSWAVATGAILALVVVTVGSSAGAIESYPASVLADAPVAYLRLGEQTGTTAVNTAGTPNGMYVGGVLLGRPGALSLDSDTSIGLDGADDTVRASNTAAFNPTAALTLEAWVKPDAITAVGMIVVRKYPQYELSISSSGRLVLGLWKGSTKYTVTSPVGSLPAGTWSHVVGTWDGTTGAVYIDGFQRGSGTIAGPISTSTNSLFIGTGGGTSNQFPGQIDEVAIYPSALSQARVQAHLEAAGDITPPALSLLSPAPGSVMDATPNFGGHAGKALGDVADVTVRVYAGPAVSGMPVGQYTATRHQGGSYSVVAAPALTSGVYTAQAVQTDETGNVGVSTSTFTVDASADPYLLVAGDISACDSVGDSATAALLDRLPGVVSTTGDTVYDHGTPEEYTNCYDPTWGRHLARTRPGVGDHEYETPGATGYYGYFGAAAGDPTKGYYSYDISGWHVVVLNTNCEQLGGCEVGSPEERWLRADLAANARSCTAAIVDKPRFSSGSIHGSRTSMIPFWQALYDAGVELVLSGDDHDYERFAPQRPDGTLDPTYGVRQIVVGVGGSWFYPFSNKIEKNSEVRNNDTFGVLKLTLRPSSYEWVFVPQAGKTFTDSGTTACHGVPGGTDTTAPLVTLTQPADGSSTSSQFPSFSGAAGSASGDLPTISVRLYSGTQASGSPLQTLTTQASGASWSVQPTSPLASGTYTAQAQQQDTATNTGTSTANTFTITGTPPPAYPSVVLADGPAGYWRLDEPTGSAAANDVAGTAGAYAGACALGVAGALTSASNTAVSLDGASGTISIPSYAAIEPGAAFTLELWVRRSRTKRDEVLLSKGSGAYELAFTKPDFLELREVGGGRIAISTGKISDTTTWHHIVVTVSGASVAIYIDGAASTGKVTPRPLRSSGTPLTVGSNGSDFFAGGVDEVAVYATALSAASVQQHYATR